MSQVQKSWKEDFSPEGEIDFSRLFGIIWKKRAVVSRIAVVFFFVGLLVAIVSPKKYRALSVFVPQTEGAAGGMKLGGLASLAGINIGDMSGSSEIPPALYPKIVSSIQFKKALLETSITLEKDQVQTTYYDYYENFYSPGFLSSLYKYTFGLPWVILDSLKGEKEIEGAIIENQSSLVRLTEQEVEHFKRMEDQINVKLDENQGTVELSFEMPEALMAAEMALAAEKLLQEEVIAFRIQSAREQLKFTNQQLKEKQRDFIQKQTELANFRDMNQNISSAVANNQMQRLEADYSLSFDVYTEVAKQYEQSKLRVSKDTPVFTVINPVSIPSEKSAPNRGLIVVLFSMVGVIMGIGVVFAQRQFQRNS